MVAVVGDIDPDRTIALVERYFGAIPPGVDVPPVAVDEPPQAGEKRIELRLDSEPHLLVGFHKPVYPNPDDDVFDVIEMILAEGKTSRLHRRLVQELELATEVSAFSAPGHRYPNLFIVAATPRSPHSPGEVEQAVERELEHLMTEPVTERELQQILHRLEYEEVVRMSSNNGLASVLTEYEAVTGNWRCLIEHRRRVAAVTPADVMRVAKTFFTRGNRTVGTIVRKEAAP